MREKLIRYGWRLDSSKPRFEHWVKGKWCAILRLKDEKITWIG